MISRTKQVALFAALLVLVCSVLGYQLYKTGVHLNQCQSNSLSYARSCAIHEADAYLETFLKMPAGCGGADVSHLVVDCARSPDTDGTMNTSCRGSCSRLRELVGHVWGNGRYAYSFSLVRDSITIFEESQEEIHTAPANCHVTATTSNQLYPISAEGVVTVRLSLYNIINCNKTKV